jgi:hypothetical protein
LEYGRDIKYNTLSPQNDELLTRWILTQPENSIAPHELMAKALELEGGRMLAAWCLAWNVTDSDWSATMLRNYSAMRTHFVSMTGERKLWNGGIDYIILPENQRKMGDSYIQIPGEATKRWRVKRHIKMVVSKRGDEFSYLYHRIGVELFAMVIAKATHNRFLGNIGGKAGALGEWYKYRQTSGLNGENEKRVANDFAGGATGSRLYEIIEKNAPVEISPEQVAASHYLRSNPKKYDGNYTLKEDMPPSYFNSRLDGRRFWREAMGEEELFFRFYHATRYDSEVFNPIFLSSTGQYERLHRGLVDYLESGRVNSKLDQYLLYYFQGMRGRPVKLDTENSDIDFSLKNGNRRFTKEIDPDYNYDEIPKRIDRILRQILISHQLISSYKGLSESKGIDTEPASGTCAKSLGLPTSISN